MSTVIGLLSGKEFIVKDGGYRFVNPQDGKLTQVFVSLDEKRLITIPPEGTLVEFYDEPNDGKFLESMENKPPQEDKNRWEGYDPNSR